MSGVDPLGLYCITCTAISPNGQAPDTRKDYLESDHKCTLDAAGNLTQEGSYTYGWNEAGLLQTVSKAGSLVATYTYDHRNRRTRKLTTPAAPQGAQTVVYHYDQADRLIGETRGDGTPLRTYVWLEERPMAVMEHAALSTPPRTLYLQLDHLDTPRLAKDAAGTIHWRWDSDGYGSAAAAEDPDGNGKATAINLRFPGHYYDQESGLHYNWNRYYSPRMGRYISSDPIGIEGGGNSFGYVGGNPIGYSDPLGLVEIPNPNGVVPGGPWISHDANRPGQFLGPKQQGGGGRAQCQFVPDEANGGPPGSKGYWKTNQPGQKGWQRYKLDGKPIEANEAHKIPSPRIPGLAPLLCPLCTIIYPNGPGGNFSGHDPS